MSSSQDNSSCKRLRCVVPFRVRLGRTNIDEGGLSPDGVIVETLSGTDGGRCNGLANETSDDNVLSIDCLLPRSVSTIDGERVRGYTRRLIHIPWTPSIFLAVKPSAVTNLRHDINTTLLLNDELFMDGTGATIRLYDSVNVLLRELDRGFWRRDKFRLCEIKFSNLRARNIALRHLSMNANACYHTYSLFATKDDAAFSVAIATALRQRYSSDIGGIGSGATEDECIDLNEAFSFCDWCIIDYERGDYVRRATPSEIEYYGLQRDVFSHLPVLSYDIETIARNENVLPRGISEDQRLSSFAVTCHSLVHPDEYASVILMYAPLKDDVTLHERERRFAATTSATTTKVYLFREEKELLRQSVAMMMSNELVPLMFHARDGVSGVASEFASFLVGYNCWEYDYPFLMTRLVYYGMYEMAAELSRFAREPRFNPHQISFDLIKHVIARHRAVTGSVALSHVSRFFGASTRAETDMNETERHVKMKFDAVTIRRLYFDTQTETERFDEAIAFDDTPDAPLTMYRIARYNIQDCATVFYLMMNLHFVDIVSLYARHFFAPFVDAAHVGNSRLLPNAFVTLALRIANTVLPYRDNTFSAITLTHSDLPSSEQQQQQQHAKRRAIDSTCCLQSTPVHDGRLLLDTEQQPLHEHASPPPQPLSLLTDETDLLRVSDHQQYVGGINGATAGHFARTMNVDFASFYPSIGCAYKLSMETVRVMTASTLLYYHNNKEELIDEFIRLGIMRVFDYEPVGSVRIVEPTVAQRVLRGREELTNQVIRSIGWYEGVEFSCYAEIAATSVDTKTRRVLVVRLLDYRYEPVIAQMWQYYLQQRQRYKRLAKRPAVDEAERAEVRVNVCLEKMYKVVANSLYGYLNYAHSVTYSPATAAAVTLLSRKTFHETTWIYEHLVPRWIIEDQGFPSSSAIRCVPVYKDTDGLVFALTHALIDDRAEYRLVNRVNEELAAAQHRATGILVMTAASRLQSSPTSHNFGVTRLEVEDQGSRLCSIMGKKKYWRVTNTGSVITKGFEKNAQPYVKLLVLTIQRNFGRFLQSESVRIRAELDRLDSKPQQRVGFQCTVSDPVAFYERMFVWLHTYYETHGVVEFVTHLLLNPREYDSPEARFIANTLTSCQYDVGDRVKCVYRVDESDPFVSDLQLVKDFDIVRDTVNYYKSIRRYAAYLVQLIEGTRDHTTGNSGKFDAVLREAFARWLNLRRSERSTASSSGSQLYDWIFSKDSVDKIQWDEKVITFEPVFIVETGIIDQ